jgi:hypothetical protein
VSPCDVASIMCTCPCSKDLGERQVEAGGAGLGAEAGAGAGAEVFVSHYEVGRCRLTL